MAYTHPNCKSAKYRMKTVLWDTVRVCIHTYLLSYLIRQSLSVGGRMWRPGAGWVEDREEPCHRQSVLTQTPALVLPLSLTYTLCKDAKCILCIRRDTACNEGYWEPIKLNGWPICCWWLAFAYKWTHCCKYILHGGHWIEGWYTAGKRRLRMWLVISLIWSVFWWAQRQAASRTGATVPGLVSPH